MVDRGVDLTSTARSATAQRVPPHGQVFFSDELVGCLLLVVFLAQLAVGDACCVGARASTGLVCLLVLGEGRESVRSSLLLCFLFLFCFLRVFVCLLCECVLASWSSQRDTAQCVLLRKCGRRQQPFNETRGDLWASFQDTRRRR